MLTLAVALPLLFANTLDASPAPARPRAELSPTAPSGPDRSDPTPSLENTLRPPELALRRTWSAVGCQVVQVGTPVPLRGGVAKEAARQTEDGRLERFPTRGPPRRVS